MSLKTIGFKKKIDWPHYFFFFIYFVFVYMAMTEALSNIWYDHD
jgi:hypothetical protein